MSKISQPAPKDMNGLIQNLIQKETSKKENDSFASHKKGVTREDNAQCKAIRKKDKRAEMENVQFQLLEMPKYSKAYRRMRGMIPPYIATMNLPSLIDTGLPKAVAERIWSKRSCTCRTAIHPLLPQLQLLFLLTFTFFYYFHPYYCFIYCNTRHFRTPFF